MLSEEQPGRGERMCKGPAARGTITQSEGGGAWHAESLGLWHELRQAGSPHAKWKISVLRIAMGDWYSRCAKNQICILQNRPSCSVLS